MYVLLRGLRGSMAHLPLVVAEAAPGTRIDHPAYAG
jgi:hypothetical protein